MLTVAGRHEYLYPFFVDFTTGYTYQHDAELNFAVPHHWVEQISPPQIHLSSCRDKPMFDEANYDSPQCTN